MFAGLRKWRQRRVLRSAAIPDALWREALESLPFVAIYTDDELARLRDKVVLFLSAKAIVGARGHDVTPLQRVIIAIQACVLVLNLDMAYYDGWENVIVYPDEFIPGLGVRGRCRRRAPERRAARRRGDAGRPGRAVVARRRGVRRLGRRRDEPRHPRIRAQARHAQRRGERLSAAAGDDAAAHLEEIAHRAPTTDFRARVERGERHGDRPVRGRVAGRVLRRALRSVLRRPDAAAARVLKVYKQFMWFYKQDPASRTELLLDE